MIRHRLRSRDGHDGFGAYPTLVIEVEGIDDVYRLARHLERGQVEFIEMGNAILRGLDRRWPGIVRALVARMGPSRGGYPGRRPRRVNGRQDTLPKTQVRGDAPAGPADA